MVRVSGPCETIDTTVLTALIGIGRIFHGDIRTDYFIDKALAQDLPKLDPIVVRILPFQLAEPQIIVTDLMTIFFKAIVVLFLGSPAPDGIGHELKLNQLQITR